MTEPTTTTTNAIAETPEGQEPPASPAAADSRPLRRRVLSSLVFAGIALTGVLVVLYAWQLPPF
ncbi:MAG TPA: HlyD family secretion protein, partial [Pseudomonas sp.]|nr:HlyD family secretion protein [Pseudomonas sp.]